MKGKIVLIPFPFTDLTGAKLRPALVLLEGEKDCVVAFISSKLPAGPSVEQLLIPEDHKEFGRTGLKRASVVRLDKIATISKTLLIGEVEQIGNNLRTEINRRLRELFVL